MQIYLFFRKLLGNGPWMLTFARRCHTPRPRRRPQRVCRNDKRSKGGRLLNLSTFSSRNKRRQRKNVEQLPSFSLPPDGVLLKIGGPRESESDVFLTQRWARPRNVSKQQPRAGKCHKQKGKRKGYSSGFSSTPWRFLAPPLKSPEKVQPLKKKKKRFCLNFVVT